MRFFWSGETPPGLAGGGGGGIGGSTGATDNRLLRADGAGGATVQSSAVSVDDTGNVTLPARLLGKQGANVASDTDIVFGNGNYFVVTGTTTISSVLSTGWTGGSIVVLQFAASVTVEHASGSGTFDVILLAGAANFSATAGDTLVLVFDSGNSAWREISRTVI